jgi:hypothetical protein
MMHISYRDFTDGQSRPVYIDDDGNQYVCGDDGQPGFGVWLAPDSHDADLPMFVARLEEGLLSLRRRADLFGGRSRRLEVLGPYPSFRDRQGLGHEISRWHRPGGVDGGAGHFRERVRPNE